MARYDGIADWYDAHAGDGQSEQLGRILGPGSGLCLDLGMWISTDVDDFAAAAREVARVLAPDGVFVFHGVHPCFNAPCVEHRSDGALIVHATYQRQGRHTSAPWWRAGGIRERVGGMNHLPLATLLNTFLAAGLSIRQVAEFDDAPIPSSVTVRATKTVVPV